MQTHETGLVPYKLAIISLRSVETGERGYYIGEPMLAMMADGTPEVAMSIDPAMLTVPGDTAIGILMNNFRKLFPIT